MKCFCHKPTSLIRHVSRNKWFLPWVPCPMPPLQLNLQIRYPIFFFCSSVWTTLGNCHCPIHCHCHRHCHILVLISIYCRNTLARLAMNFYGATFTSASSRVQGRGFREGQQNGGEWWILDQKSESDGAEPFKARHGCSLNKHIHDEIMLAHPNRCCT